MAMGMYSRCGEKRLVLVLVPMLVHDGRRMLVAFVIDVEMDVDPRQQQAANQCAQRQDREGAATS